MTHSTKDSETPAEIARKEAKRKKKILLIVAQGLMMGALATMEMRAKKEGKKWTR